MSSFVMMKKGTMVLEFQIKNHEDMELKDWVSFRRELQSQLNVLIDRMIANPPAEPLDSSSLNHEQHGESFQNPDLG